MLVIAMFKVQAGITLVELIVTIVILGIALVAVSLALSSGLSRSADTLLEIRAVALGQAYLDEILGKRFDERSSNGGVPPCRDPAIAPGVIRDCTLEANFGSEGLEGTDRSRFDDVDDYHGLDEGSGGLTPNLLDADGLPRSGYDNFRAKVDVRYIHVLLAADEEYQLSASALNNEDIDDNYDAKLITVTVYYNGAVNGIMFSAYKSNF